MNCNRKSGKGISKYQSWSSLWTSASKSGMCLIERYTRAFNYPDKSRLKGKADLDELGIKTFFCSNVCAAYRKRLIYEDGRIYYAYIFNEDMIYAGKIVLKGYLVAYQADARVFHSHNYGNVEQFKRNFDLAVSQADHPEIFGTVKSEKEGICLVKIQPVICVKFISHGWLLTW